ncbi:zinc finger protein 616-like [Bacillus rossius redtenbacheri]|uniref:zinc finger protein 616-like n=1 Tax=Bacillus rossius redtenbacheri TaxID=93214 RepID=UPI002FDE5E3D
MQEEEVEDREESVEFMVLVSQLCRVCAQLSEKLVPMFGEDGSPDDVVGKIHTHLPIMVTDKDLLPVNICEDCMEKLEVCHKLVSTCLDADSVLRNLLGLPSQENEHEIDEIKSEVDTEFIDVGKDMSHEENNENLAEDGLQEFDEVTNSQVQDTATDENTDTLEVYENVDGSLMNETTGNLQDSSIDSDAQYPAIAENLQQTDVMTSNEECLQDSEMISNELNQAIQYSESNIVEGMMTEFKEEPDQEDCTMPAQEEFTLHSNLKLGNHSNYKVMVLKTKSTKPVTTSDILNVLKLGDKHSNQLASTSESFEGQADGFSDVTNKSKFAYDRAMKMEDEAQLRWNSKVATVPSENDNITYLCVYCDGVVVGNATLLAHQLSEHSDCVFVCTLCEPNRVFYESKQFYEQHMVNHDENVTLMEQVSTNAKEPTEVTIDVSKSPDLSPISEAIPGMKNDDIQLTSVFKIHVESSAMKMDEEGNEVKSKFRLKLPKAFKYMSKDLQSKIIKTIHKVVATDKDKAGGECENQSPDGSLENSRYAVKVLAKNLNVPRMKKSKVKEFKCKVCESLFPSREKLSEHRAEGGCMYKCQFCGKQFQYRINCIHHERVHTGEKPFVCEFCGKKYRTSTIFRTHLATHDDAQQHVCPDCGKVFTNKAGYQYHRITHSDCTYLCDVCGKTLKHISSLRIHKHKHSNPDYLRRYCCDLCNKKYENSYRLREHRRVHTNERPYKCPDCAKMFRKLGQLKQHSIVHSNMRKYKCHVCERSFKRRTSLSVHLRTHGIQSQHRCMTCFKLFPDQDALMLHKLEHPKEPEDAAVAAAATAEEDDVKPKREVKEFRCSVCGKVLSSKVTLRLHMMIHTGEKPFRCNVCGKSFTVKLHLEVHYRRHTGEKPYKCKYCDIAFAARPSLVVHERIHTGEKPFPCDQCDKAFRSKINLMQHLVVHSDVRPFKCTICTRGFRRRDALEAHTRTHTGERPYACRLCGRAFKQKGDCNKHEQTHSKPSRQGRGPAHKCHVCKLIAPSKEMLQHHFASSHGVMFAGLADGDTIIISQDDILSVPEVEIQDATVLV